MEFVVIIPHTQCERDKVISVGVLIYMYNVYIYVTGSGKRYTIAHIIKIELLAPRDRVSSQL